MNLVISRERWILGLTDHSDSIKTDGEVKGYSGREASLLEKVRTVARQRGAGSCLNNPGYASNLGAAKVCAAEAIPIRRCFGESLPRKFDSRKERVGM
jgi:hypothetical protein